MKNIPRNIRILVKTALILFLPIVFNACKKYIEIDTPSSSIDVENAFSTNTGAAQVLTGVYARMTESRFNGTPMSCGIIPELSADNLTLFDPDVSLQYMGYYRNALDPNYLNAGDEQSTFWVNYYRLLYTVNTAIEQLTDNKKLTPNIKNRLLGEAHFMRAFCYFYLINFYGEVPLVLSTAYRENASIRKSTSTEVFKQIIVDLKIAEGLLDVSYVSGDASKTTTDRLRPNLISVYALKARVYLYEKNYAAAEAASTKVISEMGYGLSSLDGAFLKNSTETIWGLQPVEIGLNSPLATLFLLPETGPNGFDFPVYASASLVRSFEAGDARKNKWLGMVNVDGKDYYYPTKYKRGFIQDSKDISEYTIVLRVAEQYLIRSEARNEQNNTSGAIEDLNAIRQRSRSPITDLVKDPLPPLLTTLSQAQLRPIILNERRVELFAEWGHRWFDLRRSGMIDVIMTEEEEEKGGQWETYKGYFPIPQIEITINPKLTQTPGYSK